MTCHDPRMSLPRRHRRWIALLALLALLFQQVAMAAYFCPVETAAKVAAADLAMPCHQDTEDPRCAEHCNPHQQVSADLGPLTVPMAAILPAMAWLVSADPRSTVSLPPTLRANERGPPLAIQFCTLLI
jgi:hypothetical protein